MANTQSVKYDRYNYRKALYIYENVREEDIDYYIPENKLRSSTRENVKRLINNFKNNHYVEAIIDSEVEVNRFENIILYTLYRKLGFIDEEYNSKWQLNKIEKAILSSQLDKHIIQGYKNIETLKRLEELEEKYLTKYEYFMRFIMDELLADLSSKNRIKLDWEDYWETEGISSYTTGAERIVYSHLNGKGIGDVNSAPVGSDLFFEVEDAFIHIDLKTAVHTNKTEYYTYINVGNNQTSYKSNVYANKKDQLIYEEASLPYSYTLDLQKNNDEKTTKPCLTYFISLLFDKDSDELLSISITSMPNGELESLYGSDILQVGKNPFDIGKDKEGKYKDPKIYQKTIRYSQFDNIYFKTIHDKTRIRVLYVNRDEKDIDKKDQHFDYYNLEDYLYRQSSTSYDVNLNKFREDYYKET